MASTTKLNYDCKAFASVVNYDHKCDTTIWRITKGVFTQAMWGWQFR